MFKREDYEIGEPNEIKADFTKIQLPEESLSDFGCRNEEQVEVINFLLMRQHRLLHLYGKINESINTIVKAVKYAAERDMTNFTDGAIKVDLEGEYSFRKTMNVIFQKLGIYSEKDPETDEVVNWFRIMDNERRSFLIIFDNYEKISSQQVRV